MAVGDDAALLTQLETGGPGDGTVRRDADGKDSDIRLHGVPAGQKHPDATGCVLKAGHPRAEAEMHTVFRHVLVQQLRHFKVQRRHDLIGPLDDRDLKTEVGEVFRRLQPDEAAADHSGAFCVLSLHGGNDGVHVGNGPELHDFRGVHAGKVGLHGRGAGG